MRPLCSPSTTPRSPHPEGPDEDRGSEATRAEERLAIRDHLTPRIQGRLHSGLTLSDAAISYLLAEAEGGMRVVEKEMDHVMAGAQLDEALGANEEVCDADGRISLEYARRTIEELRERQCAALPRRLWACTIN